MLTFKSILLVEDDPISIFVINKIIVKACVTENFIVKTNGEKGLEYITEEINKGNACPELILLDLNMPFMDGMEFLEALYKFKKDIQTQIVVITNAPLRDDKIKNPYFEIGLFIEKPLTHQKLTDALTALKVN